MPTTIGFGKLEREMLSNNRLPADLRRALIEFKNHIKTAKSLKKWEHQNREGLLPDAPIGCAYYEFYVGEAHAGDPEPRGKRRLVALLNPARDILKVYFSDSHYTLGIWRQLQYP